MSCIVVLGMHRSGTSCLTGIMQRFGVELGEVFTANPHNKKGNRESAQIMSLNDNILAFNGGSWDEPVIVAKWNQQQREERDAIIAELSYAAFDHWGFKDPRTLLTLPFWSEAIEPQYIGTVRHPVSVARSLKKRGDMPIEKGFSLWLYYNQQLLRLAQEHDFPIVNFDLPTETYLSDASRKLASLGLDEEKSKSATEFFDKNLRTQLLENTDDEPLPEEVSNLYRELIRLV